MQVGRPRKEVRSRNTDHIEHQDLSMQSEVIYSARDNCTGDNESTSGQREAVSTVSATELIVSPVHALLVGNGRYYRRAPTRSDAMHKGICSH